MSSSDETDEQKWQRMYDNHGTAKEEEEETLTAHLKSQIRVVTFDLDNTLWKTSAVIDTANNALADYLEYMNIYPPQRTEVYMRDLFMQNKAKYCPLAVSEAKDDAQLDAIKAPILLTQLRKDAVKQILMDIAEWREKGEEDIDAFCESAFQCWTNARHDAIPSNLAMNAVECLERIRQMKTLDGHSVIVGAITDGNSDPRNVDIFANYFDFCVNSEQIGIGKPDRRVYDAAIRHISTRPEVQGILGDDFDFKNGLVGPWWCHVGDDFIKDIVAAKDLKMRSIYSRELILDKLRSKASKNAMPTMTTEDKQAYDNIKEDSEDSNKVRTMIIGSDDFLLDSIQREFADAIVDDFASVSTVLSSWHEGIMQDAMNGEQESVDGFKYNDTGEPVSIKPPIEVPMTKFCISCGLTLPIDAKFCSSCGDKQPIIDTNSLSSEWKLYDPKELGVGATYNLGISAVIPRPVAVITSASSLGDDAIINCAPFSYTGLFSHDPPIVAHGICLSNGNKKDTLINIEETGQWVYNVLSESYVEAANACSEAVLATVDEMEMSGLSPLDSSFISVPRIEQAKVSMECVLDSTKEIRNDKGEHTTTIVFGRVVKYHVHESVLVENDDPNYPQVDLEKVKACGRAGDITYWPVGEAKELKIPRP